MKSRSPSATGRLDRQRAGALVGVGLGEDLLDVPVGVVVGEDRPVPVARRAGGAQVAGGGVDRVVGVGRVAPAVAVGVDAVGGPGGGHELHPAEGARRRGPEVLAEAGLDLVDRGQDRDAALAEPVARASRTRRSGRAPAVPRALLGSRSRS